MNTVELNADHRFFHDKEEDLADWRQNNPLPKVMIGLTLINKLMEWDHESKATRWEDIRWAIQESGGSRDGLAPDIDLYNEDDHGVPGNKDSAWVEDVAFTSTQGLLLLIRYLDDYTFRQPVWCSHFVKLR